VQCAIICSVCGYDFLKFTLDNNSFLLIIYIEQANVTIVSSVQFL